jgi:hypothetical protein
MNDEHLIDPYKKGLVARYIKLANDEERYSRMLEEAKSGLGRAGDLKFACAKMLKAENIDPDNIPLIYLDSENIPQESIKPVSSSTNNDPKDAVIVHPGQFALVSPENNGHTDNGQETTESETARPINKTHAFFILMKKSGNTGLTQDEIYQRNLEANYGLSKDDVARIIGRQNPREMIYKEGDKYFLTERGLKLNRFRKVEAY